eukprot:CAMPEP_0175158656 /NCGR_PEP_ID=MMETSP0087-20121206/22948_1 /TAXON_ID=136419 /ORGANISM="Unknown Unknown, Strain D1" /LENGTH=70 /DNA_ID=CAMNT_0016446539 /DNA_START=103 /DNA_END=311 /DNA_ORIENTATION=+
MPSSSRCSRIPTAAGGQETGAGAGAGAAPAPGAAAGEEEDEIFEDGGGRCVGADDLDGLREGRGEGGGGG